MAISNEELRVLQMSELRILVEVLKICKDSNLRVYLSSGTLLGAVRHNGFIPWDDDIDICMPRKDYSVFRKIAAQKLSPDFELCDYKNRQTNDFAVGTMLKVFNKKVFAIRSRGDGSITTQDYAWIDIFPLDGLPNGRFLREVHKIRLYLRKRVMSLAIWKEAGIAEQKSLAKKIIAVFIKTMHIPQLLNLDRKSQRIKLEKLLIKYSFDECDFCINMLGDYELKEICPTAFYGKPQLLRFEDIDAPVPENYHGILKIIYGEYMTLPPKEDQVCKHIRNVIVSQ